ncbi:NAD(+)--rifampin ADP-ribosyltransferase [Aurantiacibacter luteus]|uniref:Rifampin ADP-ribosyltransferase domain-containing protein n=1 Tax=Aurantiacibacter luteus TaxID=1581420 RepID=A0A0G9MZN4_9SPHN|nr:NAD(+)--rifampin ADP-ribosyltransferase [Aurantiacibacter luteus]KLE34738.1 hypothetical protein AAW00_11345 [Aurantiacibacter luteus]
MSEADPFPQVYLHGTRAELKAGDLITVDYTSNFDDRALSWVYFSAAMHAAKWGSALARGEGAERIYAVVPTGPIEDDPNVTDKKFPGNPTRSYRSRDPLLVVGELTSWEPFSPEEVQRMKDGLAELKRQGKDVIID